EAASPRCGRSGAAAASARHEHRAESGDSGRGGEVGPEARLTAESGIPTIQPDHNEDVSSVDAGPLAEAGRTLSPARHTAGDRGAGEIALAVFVLAVATVAAVALRPHVSAPNLVMPYLVGVVAVAVRCSRRIAVATSFLSVAAFDYFCVLPYY